MSDGTPNNITESARSVIETLYYAYMPFCVVVGLVGNTMVWVLIKSNRMLNRLPTNTYLLSLAGTSSLFLFTLLVFWLEQDILLTPTFTSLKWTCKLLTFLAHFCDFSTVWLIVMVGLERLVLLIKRCRTLSLERVRYHILILLSTSFIFNSWIIYVANEEGGECGISSGYEHIYTTFATVESVVCVAVPSIIIIFSNVIVVIKLQSHLKRIPSSPSVSFHTTEMPLTTNSMSCKTNGSYSRQSSHGTIAPVIQKPRIKGLRYTDIQLTRSLLIVTWMFILLNIPNYTYRILNAAMEVEKTRASWMVNLSIVTHVMLYTHHAFLFYLYIFYSPQMKRRLLPTALKLLECYCLKPDGILTDH